MEVGVGMMVRGEVCLIVAQKGVELGLIDGAYMPAVILLVVLSSLVTPVLLKVAFKKFPSQGDGGMEPPASALAHAELIEKLDGLPPKDVASADAPRPSGTECNGADDPE